MTLQNCDRCKNKGICKYEEEARAFESAVMEIDHPEVLSAYVTCKRFWSIMDQTNVFRKVNKELKDGKSVADVAKEFNMSESKVRLIKRSAK